MTTPEQRAAFVRRRRVLIASHAVLWLGMAALLILDGQAHHDAAVSLFGLPGDVVQPIAWLSVAVGSVLWFREWRCPACRKHLGSLFRRPRSCPRCSAPLV